MKNKMKTGRAYAFFNYEGRYTELVGHLGIARDMANFPDNLGLVVLDDKISTNDMEDKKRLPAKITKIAETTKVYGSVSSNCSQGTFRKLSREPVKASSLRYLVMAEAPNVELSDTQFNHPLGQGRANQVTAGMLNEVLSIVADGERKIGASDVYRGAVFYQDGRNRAQRCL